ncbi:hypothetical protein SYNPS1DRAFT_29137 [Syncephalis pseudoplumigaleata]|uniref:Uncharacterized protein n=1 Tax=Syncephalis pseudoplumigaleata TaxID=1712513 RepID=A0A4V1J1H9_9FUNG|nr:hypothetical protein SYNPS1DRAFT_29137 [Syncephalis pseudoplumigaleata]|eukprot:RKP25119.1 hypothetical protein SYNPS1DRAFT_29137 [Syncephalis pseudoplumigaleata]
MDEEEGDADDRTLALLSSSLSSAGSWLDSDEDSHAAATRPGKPSGHASSAEGQGGVAKGGRPAMPPSGKSLASIAAMANASKEAGADTSDDDDDVDADEAGGRGVCAISIAQSICGVCSQSADQSSWIVECEACQVSRKPSAPSNASGRGQQRKKGSTTATTTNARRRTTTPRSGNAKRKPNRKTKSAALPAPPPPPPPMVVSTLSTNAGDEDEDEDICPVCDTDCTCKPATLSAVESKTASAADVVATTTTNGGRPAGKAVPLSIKTTLARSSGGYDSNGEYYSDEDEEDEEVVYQRLVDRLRVLGKGRPIPAASQASPGKQHDSDDLSAHNSLSSFYSSSLASFEGDDDGIRLSDSEISSQDDDDDDDTSSSEGDDDDEEENEEDAIANITLEMDDLDEAGEETAWSPSAEQDMDTLLELCIDGHDNQHSSAVSTPTPLTDLGDDEEINDSDMAMEEERYLVSMEQVSDSEAEEGGDRDRHSHDAGTGIVGGSPWEESEDEEEDEETFEAYFDRLLGRPRIPPLEETAASLPTASSAYAASNATTTTTSYSAWCRPPPPPPTPTLTLAPTTFPSATTNLIASMLAETSAHGTTAADVLAAAVAAAMAASIEIADPNAMETDIDGGGEKEDMVAASPDAKTPSINGQEQSPTND